MAAKVDNLTTEQTESALRFLLYRMGMDTRREMMAEMPVIYATLFPQAAMIAVGAVCERVNAITADL